MTELLRNFNYFYGNRRNPHPPYWTFYRKFSNSELNFEYMESYPSCGAMIQLKPARTSLIQCYWVQKL